MNQICYIDLPGLLSIAIILRRSQVFQVISTPSLGKDDSFSPAPDPHWCSVYSSFGVQTYPASLQSQAGVYKEGTNKEITLGKGRQERESGKGNN